MTRFLSSTILAACVTAVLPMSFIGCGRDSDTAPRATNTPEGPAERTGRAVDNAGRDVANRTSDAANRTGSAIDRAADRTGSVVADPTDRTQRDTNTTDSRLPGMPSVTGTDTSNMSTADAAAQRLIDNARNNLQQGDVNKAKTLVSELKQDGMYNKLSAAMKANVDQLEKDVNARGTAQENR